MSYKNNNLLINHNSIPLSEIPKLSTDLEISSLNKNNPKDDTIINLFDITFDKDNGFIWNGDFSIKNSIKNINLSNYNLYDKINPSFVVKINDKDTLDVKFNIGSLANAPLSNSSVVKKQTSMINSNELNLYYEDLKKLIDEYFWDVLEKQFIEDSSKRNKENLLNYIKDNDLTYDIGFYLQSLINCYNSSYQEIKSNLDNLSNDSGHNFSNTRYLNCTNNEEFQKNVSCNLMLLELKKDADSLNKTNIRGDKQLSFLSKIDEYEKICNEIVDEFRWRISDEKKPGKAAKSKTNVTFAIGRQMVKGFKSLETDLSSGLISQDDRDSIKELENKIFLGTISTEERFNYDNLVSKIEGKYKNNLDEANRLYLMFARNGLSDESIRKMPRDTSSYILLKEYLQNQKNNFEHFKMQQNDNSSSEMIDKLNHNLDNKINHFLEKVTDSDGNQRILLDAYKQAIIDKSKLIETIQDSELQKKEYELLTDSVKALGKIQYTLEVTCGIKDTYINAMTESEKRSLFGENYQYMSFDAFLDRIEKLSKMTQDSFNSDVNNFIETFDNSSFNEINNFINLELNELKEGKAFCQGLKDYFFDKNGKINENNLKKIFINNEYSSDALRKVVEEDDNLKKLAQTNSGEINMVYDSFVSLLNSSSTRVKDQNSEVISYNEAIICTKRLLETMNKDITHRLRNEGSKKQLENVLNNIVNDSYTARLLDGKSLGQRIFKNENVNDIFFTEDGKYLDVAKILEVRKGLRAVSDVLEKKSSTIPEDLKYSLDNDTIQKIANNKDLKEAFYAKIVSIEEMLDYKVNRNKDIEAVYVKPKEAMSAINSAIYDFDKINGSEKSIIDNKISSEKKSLKEQLEKLNKEDNDNNVLYDRLKDIYDKEIDKIQNNEAPDISKEELEQIKKQLEKIEKQEENNNLKSKIANLEATVDSINSLEEDIKNNPNFEKLKQDYFDKLSDVLSSLNQNKQKEIDRIGELDEDKGSQLQKEIEENKKLYFDLTGKNLEDKNDIDNKFSIISNFRTIAESRNKKLEQQLLDENEKLENQKQDILVKLKFLIPDEPIVNTEYKKIFRELNEKLEFSMESDNYDKVSIENKLVFYDKFKTDLKDLKNLTEQVYSDDLNTSNKSFLIITSVLKELPKEDVIDLISSNNDNYRIDYFDKKYIYTPFDKVLKDIEDSGKKEEFIKIVTDFYDKQNEILSSIPGDNKNKDNSNQNDDSKDNKDLEQENSSKNNKNVFNLEQSNAAIDLCVREDFNLVPLNLKASNDLFEVLTSDNATFNLKVGESNYLINGQQLNFIQDYFKLTNLEREVFKEQNEKDLKNLDIDKVCNQIISVLDESDNENKIQLHLSEDSANKLIMTLKSYGDETSILIFTGFNKENIDTVDVINMGINANRIYNIDDVIHNLSDVMNIDTKRTIIENALESLQNIDKDSDLSKVVLNSDIDIENYTPLNLIRDINDNTLDASVLNKVFENMNSDEISDFIEQVKESDSHFNLYKLINLNDLNKEYVEIIKNLSEEKDIKVEINSPEERRKIEEDISEIERKIESRELLDSGNLKFLSEEELEDKRDTLDCIDDSVKREEKIEKWYKRFGPHNMSMIIEGDSVHYKGIKISEEQMEEIEKKSFDKELKIYKHLEKDEEIEILGKDTVNKIYKEDENVKISEVESEAFTFN